MAKITFVLSDGTRHEVAAKVGTTVMRAAVDNAIAGIEAECGGQCACATCHVYVDAEWTVLTGTPSEIEEDMLDFAYEVRARSRLSCQIVVTEEMDGLIVHVPGRQA
jgi:2Fe-2S ferredoxin